MLLLAGELAQCTSPVFQVESSLDSSFTNGVNVDTHDAKSFAGKWHPKKFSSRCTAALTTHNHAISGR